MNIQTALQQSCQLIHSDSARLDAELLLAACLGQSRTWLRTWPDYVLTPAQSEPFLAMLARCALGEPVAYVVGHREFWSLPLEVDNSTLIPRPDTELLVQLALDLMPQEAPQVLDLGTGSGAIALALAQERPDAQILAVDFNLPACQLAQRNASRLALPQVKIQHSCWFDSIEGQFDLIVSNPPYLDAADPHLAQLRYEPRSALVAADNGLADLRLITNHAQAYLRPHGWLLLEHGRQQAAAVRQMLSAAGYQHVASHRDLGGHERVSLGQASLPAGLAP